MPMDHYPQVPRNSAMQGGWQLFKLVKDGYTLKWKGPDLASEGSVEILSATYLLYEDYR